MFDELNLKEKISIIEHSDLADAKTLEGNYLHLIHDTPDAETNKKFVILRTTTQLRIQQLLTHA